MTTPISGTLPAPDAPIEDSAMTRFVTLVYGTVTYALFLAVFLYAIGFVTGFLVPKAIDSGPTSPLGESLLVNAALLGLFAVQHTIMARPWFKRAWTRVIPAAAERSTFVLVTVTILAVMFWQWRPLPGVVWQVENTVLAGAMWGVCAIGWLLVLVSTFLIDHFDLFGLRQVVLFWRRIPYTNPVFQERSIYRFVRHPLLLGFMIAFWATPTMTWGHLFFALMTTGYMLIGIQFEEHDLLAEHGDDYRAYRERVSMLVPIRKGS